MLTVPTFGTVSEEFRIFIAKNLTSRNNANVKKCEFKERYGLVTSDSGRAYVN